METSRHRWPGRVITSARSAGDLRVLALGLAVAAPLVSLPGGFSPFVLAPLAVVALAVVVAALARPVGALPRAVVLAGAVWAACFAVSALLGETPWASLVGRWPRYEGLPVLALYAGACWLGARVVGRGVPAARRLEAVVAVASIVLALFSLLDLVGITPLATRSDARSGSLLGNATDQGAVAMTMALVLIGAILRVERGRPLPVLAAAGVVGALSTVAASGSRTALGLTVLGLLLSAALHARTSRRTAGWGLPWGLGAVALLAAVALLVPTTRERLLGLGTAEGRVHQWRLSLDLVLDHPLVGIGGSRYVDAFLGYEDAAFVDFTGARRLADSPHSILLQVLVAGGLLLLAATAWGLYVVARRVAAVWRTDPATRPIALAVAAYLALACVNFTTAGPTCLAALLLGVVIAVPRGEDGPAGEPGVSEEPATDRARTTVATPVATPVAPAAAALAATAALVVLVGALVGDLALQRGVEAADRLDVVTAADQLDRAARWRPWDVDVPLIAARALAAAAASGSPAVDAPDGPDGPDAATLTGRQARDALARLPDSYEAHVALGLSLSAQGRLEEAAAVLDRAVALAPQRPDGYVQRAIARVGLGQRAEALADLRRAREIDPRSQAVRQLLRRVERQVSRATR